MREDCKYFQTRNFASGETARFCAIDLAPEAPWRCPVNCPRYTKRADAFARSTATSSASPEPELHPDAAVVLGSAEEIISAVAPQLAAEERRRRQQEAAQSETSWWQRLRQRGARWRR